VSFGRGPGQKLLADPRSDLFGAVRGLLAGDVIFANLECQLSDQKGETQSPHERLVFTGPPEGAAALARAGFTLVSLANNHMWDYGKKALFETFDNLERARVRYVGAARTRDEANGPVFFDAAGFKVAAIAVTDIWNQGPLASHPGAEHVGRADRDAVATAVREARAKGAEVVLVSHHGGVEDIDYPLPRTKAIAEAAIDAGADAFLGHHPHVVQGIAFRGGKPILYSMGNFLMEMSPTRKKKPSGFLAQIAVTRGGAPVLRVCPMRLAGAYPAPASDGRQRAFLETISKHLGGIAAGAPGPDGCFRVTAGT